MFECAIFDCDGTLVDSESLGARALEKELLERGVSESAGSLMARYRGWKLALTIEDIEARHRVSLDAGFVDSYRALVAQMFESELIAIPGVHSALDGLRMTKCVASSGPMPKIVQALRVTDLSHYFGANVFSSYVVGSWKPDPGLFLFAARSLEIAPTQCAVVEDSLIGIEAALAAGMTAFLYDPGSELRDRAPKGVRVFSEMRELPDLLSA